MGSDFIVRVANIEDAGAIAKIHIDAWRSTYSRIIPKPILDGLSYDQRVSFWRSQISELMDPAVVFVAEDSRYGLVGFASGGLNRDQPEEYDGELYAIYLIEYYQRRGIGRALFDHVSEYLRTHGIQSMIVWVLEDNPFRVFYESLGGEQVAQRRIAIVDAGLPELAYGWKDLDRLKK